VRPHVVERRPGHRQRRHTAQLDDNVVVAGKGKQLGQPQPRRLVSLVRRRLPQAHVVDDHPESGMVGSVAIDATRSTVSARSGAIRTTRANR
jgi:hypothetical protein